MSASKYFAVFFLILSGCSTPKNMLINSFGCKAIAPIRFHYGTIGNEAETGMAIKEGDSVKIVKRSSYILIPDTTRYHR